MGIIEKIQQIDKLVFYKHTVILDGIVKQINKKLKNEIEYKNSVHRLENNRQNILSFRNIIASTKLRHIQEKKTILGQYDKLRNEIEIYCKSLMNAIKMSDVEPKNTI